MGWKEKKNTNFTDVHPTKDFFFFFLLRTFHSDPSLLIFVFVDPGPVLGI